MVISPRKPNAYMSFVKEIQVDVKCVLDGGVLKKSKVKAFRNKSNYRLKLQM
jgi:hypothetical protein